ncbi:MAG: class I SAM-dependent methyltransferase [Desulfobacteraceae bacterium]
MLGHGLPSQVGARLAVPKAQAKASGWKNSPLLEAPEDSPMSRESKTFEEHYARIIEVFTAMGYPLRLIEQWTLPRNDSQTIVKLIQDQQPLNILEVGTFIGLSTLLMALVSAPDTHIHTIDPNFPLQVEMDSMRSKFYDSDKSVRTHDLARQAAEKLGVQDKITFHSGGFSTANTFASYNSSPESRVHIVGPEVCDQHGPFDFIFIDGLHYEADVFADVNLAARHVKPDGLIALHDVLGPWGSNVRRAVFRFLETRDDFIFSHDKFSRAHDIIGLLKPSVDQAVPTKSAAAEELKKGGLVQEKIFSNLSAVLINMLAPASIIQLGGDITLLEQMKNMGVSEVLAYVPDKQTIPSSSVPVKKLSLQKKTGFKKKYDLCLLLETLDLLDSRSAERVLQTAVSASDTIIFACSPPGEMGLLPQHNRPLSYWVDKFYDQGYIFLDTIRPVLEPINFSDTLIPDYNYASSFLMNLYLVQKQKKITSIKSAKEFFVRKESRIEDLELQNLHHKCIVQQKQQEYHNLSDEYHYLSNQYEKLSRENHDLHQKIGSLYVLDRQVILNTLGRIKQTLLSFIQSDKK